ncbi:MAG TPA: CbtA family protein [Methylomirabilota bacterium]|nr:CbtA family protein [Methylomirabilota bacterium]
MTMLRTVLLVGLLAGLAAGLATAVLQHFTTVPLIIAAEAYEASALPLDPSTAVAAHGHGSVEADGHAHDGAADAGWAPADGLERTLSTTVATMVSGIGFALVLIAVMIVADERITPTRALAYAAAAFAATGLAPALGLAPELPGSAAGDLVARQVWWFATAVATAAGLYALLKLRTLPASAIGVALIVAPHIVGAPQPDGYASTAPAELAAHFASTSLVVHATFWAFVGAAVGTVWQRVARA